MGPKERESLVRRSIEFWNADDWGGLRSIWSPEGVVVAPEGWPEAGTFEGWHAMLEQWRRIKDSWAEEHVELTSLEPAGGTLLAACRWILRGEASGAPLEVDAWILCEFAGGRISKMTYFMDREAARSAAAGAK
jgi:ketosteroid isomerase-like protein